MWPLGHTSKENAMRRLVPLRLVIVVQVVFVEKENCCQCTRTRQENTWRSLQDAIGAAGVPVDVVKVFIDTQSDAAQVYLDMCGSAGNEAVKRHVGRRG